MKKVIAYVHSHWDREWYREFEEFRLRLIEVFNEIIEALNNNELPCFYFDGQTSALEDYLEIFPEKTNEIKKLIKEKRLRIGPFYCSADSFLVSGECLYKNLEIGIEKSKELGETEFIGYLSDTFGHSHCIPYILKSFGINKACLWRGLGELPADLNWEGTEVTYLIQGYFQDFLHSNTDIKTKAELLKKYIDKIAIKSDENILLPIGADHLAIAKNIKKQTEELNKIYSDYQIEIATPFEYFKKITKRQAVQGEFLNNSLNFILPGVYSSRIYIKQANALSQWLLTKIAEPLQAIGHFYFNTKNKQNEINYAYKTLIKNHAHDSIYGCSTDNVHKEMLTRFKNTDIISNGIIKRTLRDLNSNKDNLSVINLSNYTYSGKVKIKTNKKLPRWMNAVKISSEQGFTDEKLYNINEIPITEDYTVLNNYIINVKNLKPFSITQITKDNICTKTSLSANENAIENEFIKFEIENKNITITDKKRNKKYKNFISLTDKADIGDSYNFGALYNDKPIYAELISHKLKEFNCQRAILSLIYNIDIPSTSNNTARTKKTYRHKIKIDAILYNQAEYLEFDLKWQNKSKNHLLQIGFNLENKIYTTMTEDLFGTIKRTVNPDFDIYKHIPAKRGIEIKPNTFPMQRFMSTNNFGLITKGNCEYEIIKNTVYLTLLRATGIISNPQNTTRGTPAGPPIETNELQCLGDNNANFAITFVNEECFLGQNELSKTADNFYGCTVSLFTDIQSREFFNIDNKNITVSSIQTKNSELQIRLFNNSDKTEEALISPYNKKIKLESKEIKNITLTH